MRQQPDGTLPVKGFDSQGRRFSHPIPSELAKRIEELGCEDVEFLVVVRAPDFPHDCIQTARKNDTSAFQVSYRTGDDLWMEAEIDEPTAVVRLFTDWAREIPDWAEGFAWEAAEWWYPSEVPEPAPGAVEEGTALARRYLDEGFLGFDAMARAIHEMSESVPPISTEQASVLLAPLWRERVIEQRSWGTTDCDRIESAFRDLSADGIVARENFACCRNCGTTEIWDEAGPEDHGFVFYHMQDTESAAAGGGLYLSYGSRTGERGDTEAIGHVVVATLRSHGLETDWNGSAESRIAVSNLRWRKRLT